MGHHPESKLHQLRVSDFCAWHLANQTRGKSLGGHSPGQGEQSGTGTLSYFGNSKGRRGMIGDGILLYVEFRTLELPELRGDERAHCGYSSFLLADPPSSG
jgi:hypothetical protein